jgi:hypothetical protein
LDHITASTTNQHRLVTTPLSPKDATTEFKEIKDIARTNGYSEEFVGRIHNKQKKKEELRRLTTLTPVSRDDSPKRRHALTFYPAITDQLKKIFKSHQIDLVYSKKGKLNEIVGNPKDEIDMLEKSGVYQIACLGCDFMYIGQKN